MPLETAQLLDHRQRESYATIWTENVRYRDTDRQGHVNNAVFATFLECARTSLLYDAELNLRSAGCEFVLAQLDITFLQEMSWPGTVEIGSRVEKVGCSSVTFDQAIFQNGECTATSRSTMVQISTQSRRSSAFSQAAIDGFKSMMVADHTLST